jgi:hypothetical protein
MSRAPTARAGQEARFGPRRPQLVEEVDAPRVALHPVEAEYVWRSRTRARHTVPVVVTITRTRITRAVVDDEAAKLDVGPSAPKLGLSPADRSRSHGHRNMFQRVRPCRRARGSAITTCSSEYSRRRTPCIGHSRPPCCFSHSFGSRSVRRSPLHRTERGVSRAPSSRLRSRHRSWTTHDRAVPWENASCSRHRECGTCLGQTARLLLYVSCDAAADPAGVDSRRSRRECQALSPSARAVRPRRLPAPLYRPRTRNSKPAATIVTSMTRTNTRSEMRSTIRLPVYDPRIMIGPIATPAMSAVTESTAAWR